MIEAGLLNRFLLGIVLFSQLMLSKNRPNVFFTRYEDLLLFNPENTLNNLVSYLGLDPSYTFSNTFVYPNQKVMRKTRGKLDFNRLTSSLKLLRLTRYCKLSMPLRTSNLVFIPICLY